MAQYVYSMLGVSKIIPSGKHILKDISLSFFHGAKIGVLGLNGAGKSTLLRIMAGIDTDIIGDTRAQKELSIGYLPQEPDLDSNKTVREIVEESVINIKKAQEELEQIYAAYAKPDADFDKLAAKQAQLENFITATDAHNLERNLDIAADALRLPEWNDKIKHLSGGEKRRVALCRLLLAKPDMLLLDEPTNHLDAYSVAWLEHFLHDYKGTVVAVTHDRYFLDNVAGWILELDRGEGIPWEGNYSSWLEQKEKRLSKEQKQQSKLQKTIRQELEWVRQNPKGRRTKNKARLEKFAELSNQEFQKRNVTSEIYIPSGPRLGKKVLLAKSLTKSFANKLLYKDLSFNLPQGGIVGIIGPNGAGKSTLFNIIIGEQQADSGNIEIGDSVKFAYVNQSRHNLDDNKTVWESVSDGLDNIKIGNIELNSRSYISRFNFRGSDQQKLVKNLSGGERNRLHLAITLKSGGNVLMLDEPTNDLDVETLRALEEALLIYPGCALIISHDRWFLDRIATHILAFEGNAKTVWFEGSYSDYESNRKKRLGVDADQLHRIKYKKINN